MTKVKSTDQVRGRYSQGGVTDDFGLYLGWWERKVFQTDPTDVTIILDPKYNKRPDLVAFDFFGKAGLQWFVLQYNTISDITTFIPGLKIVLPTPTRLFGGMLSN
jgi:hypothetical protein